MKTKQLCTGLLCTSLLGGLFLHYVILRDLGTPISESENSLQPEEHAEPLLTRERRGESSSPYTDPKPIYITSQPVPCLNVPPLPDLPNATCFAYCKQEFTSSCSNTLDDVISSRAELVCTAQIILLGFPYTSSWQISKWLSQHPRLSHKYGDINPLIYYGICPEVGLSNTTTDFYMPPYILEELDQPQNTYYLHCENCLTTAFGYSDGENVYLVTIASLLPNYFPSDDVKYIITLKNPTDRFFADYFFTFIKFGLPEDAISLYGGQFLHNQVVDAIAHVSTCFENNGPTACVHGLDPGIVPEDNSTLYILTKMVYNGCYSVIIKQLNRTINKSKIHFVKSEEYYADPAGAMQAVYSFIGLDFAGESLTTGGSVKKPILPETKALLDQFYEPFRNDLVTLLGDEKWYFAR